MELKGLSKEKAWDYAIGIVQVEGIKPSDEFLALAEKEKRGEISLEEMERILDEKTKRYRIKEAD